MLISESECFLAQERGTVYWQTDSKNCYSFLWRGSRKPDSQRIVTDIKCYERKLDVTADLGSKMAASTDEWCIDREDLVNVFRTLKVFARRGLFCI
jgi:hypothetical protein